MHIRLSKAKRWSVFMLSHCSNHSRPQDGVWRVEEEADVKQKKKKKNLFTFEEDEMETTIEKLEAIVSTALESRLA